MTAYRPPDAAVDDADLIRYLDGELDDNERARIESAVVHDAALSARLEQLRARSGRLSALLEVTDPELPAVDGNATRTQNAGATIIELNAAWAARQGMPARTIPPPHALPGWLRAAAIIAVLIGGSLFVPPVRAWIADLLVPARGRANETVGNAGTGAAVPIDTLAIRLGAAAADWTIEFTSAPSAGSLAVEWGAVDSMAAESYSAGGGEELLWMRDGLLRVRNGTASTARYRVILPARATEVTVRVPGRADVVWRVTDGGRTLDLGPGAS